MLRSQFLRYGIEMGWRRRLNPISVFEAAVGPGTFSL
jgi:hypothetical protein